MIFWNIAGVDNKDFWSFIEGFDFVSLSETWLEKKGWKRLKGKLPKSHEWDCCFAKKNKKGRAKGGFIVGKRRGWGREEMV